VGRPFPLSVKKAAFARANGKCERCGVELSMDNAEFHHRLPSMDGGESVLENCEVLCHFDHSGTDKIFRANHPNAPSRLFFIYGKGRSYGRRKKRK